MLHRACLIGYSINGNYEGSPAFYSYPVSGSKGYDTPGPPAQLLSFVIDGSASPLLVEVLTSVGSMVLLPMPLPLEIQGDRDRDQMLALSFPHSRKQGSETMLDRDSFHLEKKKELAQPRMELPPFHSMQRQWRPFVHSFRFRGVRARDSLCSTAVSWCSVT